jgi:hypothetical protein
MFYRKKIRQQLTISIPEPCGEQWSEMKKVDDCHRHCAACDRVLTDFAQMSDDELVLFFRHSKGKVCGRFRSDQLNRPLPLLPEHKSKARWWKAAALLPFAFFSKSASAQQLSPDSATTVQLPSPIIPDSLVVDRSHLSIDTTIAWNWIDPYEKVTGPIEVTGGVPFVLTGWSLTCVVSSTAVSQCVADTKPHSESSLGITAKASPTPKKLPNQKGPAGFANDFGAINPNQE